MLDVLIIADDREMREALKAYLGLKDSVRVHVETGGGRGLKQIFHHGFDLVLTALHRGPVKNADVARLVEERRPEASLVVVAEGECPAPLQAVLAEHKWTYLEEPVSVHRFADVIQEVLSVERRPPAEAKPKHANPSSGREQDASGTVLTTALSRKGDGTVEE